jgi:hypothetical protein
MFFGWHFRTPLADKRPKTRLKKIDENLVFDFRFFGKNFPRLFLYKAFCSDFELSSLRNTPKRDKTKKNEENPTSIFLPIFLGKKSTWTCCKNISVVFLNFGRFEH